MTKQLPEFSLETVKTFIEDMSKANTEAWTVQTDYFDGLVKRNTTAFSGLSDARIASFKEMSEAKTMTQAFEANLAFEEKVRDELQALQDDSVKAWEELSKNFQAIYKTEKLAEKIAEVTAAAKPKAKKAA